MLKSIFAVLLLSGYSHAIQVDSGGGTAAATTDASELTSGYLANDRLRPDATSYIWNNPASSQTGLSGFDVSVASIGVIRNTELGTATTPFLLIDPSSLVKNSGFFAIGPNGASESIGVAINSISEIEFTQNGVQGATSGSGILLNEPASHINPSLGPSRANLATGIGAHSSGSILDAIANGQTQWVFFPGGSANYFFSASTITGFNPVIIASGTDSNIGMSFLPKGFGTIDIATDTPYGLVPTVFRVAPTGNEGNIVRFQDSDGICDHDPDAATEVVTCSSDENMKENIRDADSALIELKKMRIRQYDIKSSGNHAIGTVAQELELVLPEYVKHPMKRVLKDGQDGATSITVLQDGVEVIKQVEAPEEFELVPDMLMVEQPSPWKLVKAIQELEAALASLKERVAILEAK